MTAGDLHQPEDGLLRVSFAGVGGQGVVLAGVILGEAAVRSGLWACQSAAYTVAARGGFARSEVLVSANPVACPLAEHLDIVVALSGPGWTVERERLAGGGLGLVEPGAGAQSGGMRQRVVEVPFGALARRAGAPRSANVAAVGVVAGLSSLVTVQALVSAAERHLGGARGTADAARSGYQAGSELFSRMEEELEWIRRQGRN